MSQTVTVGLDGSRGSHAAVDWAAREALWRAADLKIVQVRESEPFPSASIIDDSPEQDWSEQTTRVAGAELCRRYPSLDVSTRCYSGRPAKVLVNIAANADLLVLGSRGLSPVLGFLVGSVALPVVAQARCPVVLVRPVTPGTAVDGTAGVGADGEVVLGLDLNRPPEEPLAFAFETAVRWAARLRVVYGWGLPPAYGSRSTAVPERLAEELAQEKNEALRALLYPWRQQAPKVDVVCQTSLGWPARELLHASAGASLVVVGRRYRTSPLGTRIGSVTHAVMHHSETPVAVVPHD